MNYKKIIYMCLVLIIGAFVLYRIVVNISQSNKNVSQSQTQNNLSTQTSAGMVTVDVTPKKLSADSQAQFDVKFTTHSGNINYDMIKIATLTDDTGTKYKALSWDGGMGGHHVEGVLTFPVIAKAVKKVTLTIPNIDNKDRIFIWNVR